MCTSPGVRFHPNRVQRPKALYQKARFLVQLYQR
jgi:hypothetical protein